MAKFRPISRKEVRQQTAGMLTLQKDRQTAQINAAKDIHNYFFDDIDPRMRQTASDAGMIQEDHSALSNLPTEPIAKEVPRIKFNTIPYLTAGNDWRD